MLMSNKKVRIINVFGFFLIINLFLAQINATEMLSENEFAPFFALPVLGDGNSYYDLEKAIKGNKNQYPKAIILSFFSHSCPPCKKELPELEKLYNNFKDEGLAVYIIVSDPIKDFKKHESLFKNYLPGITTPILVDRYLIVKKRYQISFFPTLFLLNNEGKIEFKCYGYNSDIKTVLEKKIKLMLENK